MDAEDRAEQAAVTSVQAALLEDLEEKGKVVGIQRRLRLGTLADITNNVLPSGPHRGIMPNQCLANHPPYGAGQVEWIACQRRDGVAAVDTQTLGAYDQSKAFFELRETRAVEEVCKQQHST